MKTYTDSEESQRGEATTHSRGEQKGSRMKGPLPYVGGKNRLARRIIALFPEHKTYVEAFAGGAQVLFQKRPSRVEVLNDLNFEVVNFFRICREHHEELLRCLDYPLRSRHRFELLKKQDPKSLTDIQRAARFFYLLRTAFGGCLVSQQFAYGVAQNPPRLERFPVIIEQAHKRLARVQIEALPYEEVLDRYDRPTTLFYLDPPYWGPKRYRDNFKKEDFIVLERRIRNLRGKFVLSLNDRPEVRRLFTRFRIEAQSVPYSTRGRDTKPGKRFPELLILNFDPKN